MLNIYNPNQQSQIPVKPLPKKDDAPKTDFRRYQDVSGDFDNKELSYSLWWIKNKVFLYRLLIFVLLGINALLLIFNFGKWGAYIYGITDAKRMELVASRFNNYEGIKDHFKPTPLQVSDTALLLGGVNKYDAVTQITNPNKSFNVTLLYRYILGATSTEAKTITLLAGETNLVAVLGISEGLTPGGAVTFKIEQINWQRIDNHKIKDPISWQNERLNFSINNSVFQNALDVGGLKTNRVAFNLKNDSSYSYKEPSFIVGLYNGEVLVGVLPLQTDYFKSMEEKPIELRSFSSSLDVTEVKIFPQINVYDETVFLPPDK